MRALLCSALIIVSVYSLICPKQYQLKQGRCIRSLYIEVYDAVLDQLFPNVRGQCGKDGATLPIIKDNEDNDAFNRIAGSYAELYNKETGLVMDTVCNITTHRLHWIDGTPVNYSPYYEPNLDFDCVSTSQTVVSEWWYGMWNIERTNVIGSTPFTVLCVLEPTEDTTIKPTTVAPTTTTSTIKTTEKPENEQCGDYSLMDGPLFGSCFKLFPGPLSWYDAQKKCAEGFGSLTTINSAEACETAISNNVYEGMHIGAHQSTDDPNQWVWSDGNVPIGGKMYDNFINEFPVPGAGECASMMTETTAALWINENCEGNKQPFVCRRDDVSTLPKSCPLEAPKAGEDIFPPGFPNPDTPCEYVLHVSEMMLVELEVISLVAEVDQDFLEILEGSSGPHPIANLTGTILVSTKYRTLLSNVMRVNWKPDGVGNGRGFRIRYNEVDP